MARSKLKNHKPPRPPVHALILEDDSRDVELVVAALRGGGYSLTFEVVDAPVPFRERLASAAYDVILADYNLRTWTASDALEILQELEKDIPLIVVTGTLGDEAAVECIKQGAADYVLKQRLERLPPVVDRALREKAQRDEAARLEELIHRAKKEWELTFDTVPDPVLLIDEQRVIRRANRAAAALFALRPNQVVGRHCYELVHGASEPRRDCPHQRLVESGREQRTDIEEPALGKSFDATATPLRDASGKVCGCVHVLRDITERHQMEAALRAGEERYRTLAEAAHDYIFVISRQGTIEYVNSYAARQFSLRSEEVIGRRREDFLPPEVSECQQEALARILETGEAAYIEANTLLPGSEVWLGARLVPLRNEAGQVASVLGVARDITEQRRAGEALREANDTLRALISASPVGIVLLEPTGTVKLWNLAAERMFGWSEAEVLGRRLPIIPQGKEGEHRALLERVLRGEEFKGVEVVRRRKDGSTVDISVSTGALLDAQGKVRGIVGIMTDVSERKHLEEQFRHSQKMEAVGRLAGGIAHDFNNLLTAITGYSDLLLNRLGGGDGLRKYVEEIRRAGDRAAALTRQLLAFSRRQILAPQVLDLNATVAGVDKMLRRLIGEDIELITRCEADLGRVMADPGQVEQVILNLAVNARDAMPAGGKLTFETANVVVDEAEAASRLDVAPGRYVMLAVSDTGCGMEPEVLSHVFEPFFTTKEQGKGTGLGLATVYGIVKQSGGHIEVSSEPGRGTRLQVYLPRVDGVLTPNGARPVRTDLPRGSETILLVEDDETVRRLVREILRGSGYRVLETRGGDQAVLLSERYGRPIHLLLTDVVMPQMSGRELAEGVARSHPEAKVLYMSGYTDAAVVHRGVPDTGGAYLQKPFPPEALARKVREILDGASVKSE